MRTTYKEYGCTASITDKQDGTARLIVRNQYGQKVKDSIHKNRACALAAWRRLILNDGYILEDYYGAHVIHEDTINGTLAVLRQCLTKEC